MSYLRPIVYFLVFLIGSLGLVFLLHTQILDQNGLPKYANSIVLCYAVNALLAAFIYIILFVFRYKLKNYIGFLFMGGSFLKFIFFFVIFYPIFREDGVMDKFEFAAFFAPYAVCLIVETIFTSKMLKKLD